ncbi:MAG: glycosyltransferase [Bacteroidetes bacterium]|nr:glycosyltransferase [Bacteroidota bacterium]
MKIAAIVITYNPNIDEVANNIMRFIDSVDKVIIWNNSLAKILLPDNYKDKIIYMGDGKNKFIAEPLNKALQFCILQKYDYLLTMDQDSTWINCNEFVEKVKNLHDEKVAIYAPNVNKQYPKGRETHEVESVITSGSLCNVLIMKELGGFREDYQIYWVDGEICYWARVNGYKLVVLSLFDMVQQFGKPSKSIFGNYSANYSASSYYFLFRNMLWMRREFPQGVSLKCVIYTSKLYLTSVLLGEDHKARKLFAIAKAYSHGIFSPIMKRKSLAR